MERMWSRVSMEGERPPWRQKIWSRERDGKRRKGTEGDGEGQLERKEGGEEMGWRRDEPGSQSER